MKRLLLAVCWLLALGAWTGLAYALLTFHLDTIRDPLHPLRVGYYVLTVLAPALTFYPLGRWMGIRTFVYEAIISWGGLITVLTFVSPNSSGLAVYLLFMAFFFGAVSTIFLPLGYALGFRLLTLRVHRRDTGRARREAYLAALFVVLSAAMHMGGFYTPLNAVLLAFILLLVESFALARKPGMEQS